MRLRFVVPSLRNCGTGFQLMIQKDMGKMPMPRKALSVQGK